MKFELFSLQQYTIHVSAYLHDLADILLYLLMPLEDFRSRPFRFLVREILVRRIITPILDLWASADCVNQLIVWLVT
jgi:sorting nexin-13